MRRLRHSKTPPSEVAPGQWYRWHKHLWSVRNVSRFWTSTGELSGWVIIRCRGRNINRTVDLVKFAAVARPDYWLDRWREKRK